MAEYCYDKTLQGKTLYFIINKPAFVNSVSITNVLLMSSPPLEDDV